MREGLSPLLSRSDQICPEPGTTAIAAHIAHPIGAEIVSAQEEHEEEHGEAVVFLWIIARKPGADGPIRGGLGA